MLGQCGSGSLNLSIKPFRCLWISLVNIIKYLP